MRRIPALLLVALLFVGLRPAMADAPETWPDISHADLVTALGAHAVTLLDCNHISLYESGHIPTAIHFYSNKDRLASLLPKDKKALIVSYCTNTH